MNRKLQAPKPAVRYSEAFRIEIVRELETQGTPIDQVRRKYGIGSASSIQTWLARYGNGSRGKVVRVETPQEINQLQALQARARRLESALADAHVELALERGYLRVACERAGIGDVAEFKKKVPGERRM